MFGDRGLADPALLGFPNELEELRLAQNLAGMSNETGEKIELTRSERDFTTIEHHAPAGEVDIELNTIDAAAVLITHISRRFTEHRPAEKVSSPYG